MFAIWGFVKDHLSPRAVLATAALVGFSLLVYFIWEVRSMMRRTMLQLRFNRAIKDHPADPAKAINDYVEQTRTGDIRGGYLWMVNLVLTVPTGFAGALLLIYNAFANLTGLAQWP